MKITSLFCLIPIVALAHPVSKPFMDINYATMEEAATAALQRSITLSINDEEAGGLFEMVGRFYYTLPTTSHSDNEFDVGIKIPENAKLVGIYHTHPNKEHSELFSIMDIEVADQLNKVSFIGVVKTGKIICYVPGQDKRIRIGDYKDSQPGFTSKGHEISSPLWTTQPNNN